MLRPREEFFDDRISSQGARALQSTDPGRLPKGVGNRTVAPSTSDYGVIGSRTLDSHGGSSAACEHDAFRPCQPRGLVDVVRADDVRREMVFPVARSHMGSQMDHDAQEGWLRTGIDVFCWRYQGLTAIERPAYDVALSLRLPLKPEASRNEKS